MRVCNMRRTGVQMQCAHVCTSMSLVRMSSRDAIDEVDDMTSLLTELELETRAARDQSEVLQPVEHSAMAASSRCSSLPAMPTTMETMVMVMVMMRRRRSLTSQLQVCNKSSAARKHARKAASRRACRNTPVVVAEADGTFTFTAPGSSTEAFVRPSSIVQKEAAGLSSYSLTQSTVKVRANGIRIPVYVLCRIS